jgi:hypothetical protein
MKHLIWYVLTALTSSFVTAVVIANIDEPPRYQTVDWRHLTADELGHDSFTQEMPPMDILVRFVDHKDFWREMQQRGAVAYTYPAFFKKPCTVTLPAGRTIRAWPRAESAIWDPPLLSDPQANDVFAHEFLHCLYPNWHAPWTALYTAQNQ